jgi:hypothetical protein
MTLREAIYARAIGRTEKIILLVLACAGLVLQTVYYRLLWWTSSMRNDDVNLSDHLRLFLWLAIFSWVYARVIVSFRSPWRFLAVLPFLYYFIPLVVSFTEPITKR